MVFDNITATQTVSTHVLFRTLRRLRVIGLIETEVLGGSEYNRYSMSIKSYHPSKYGSPEEDLYDALYNAFNPD